MDRKQQVTITNMCMVYQDNRVLVQDKVDRGWSGMTFPGGHVEMNESFTDAVVREVFEETGLTIYSPRLCGIKDFVNEDGSRYMVLFYKTDKFEGSLKSSDEGEVYWIDLEKLQSMELAHDMDKILEIFLNDNLSEFFYYLKDGEWVCELK